MGGCILVGTASWTDPTLIKSHKFYPKGCSSAEARLRFYASRFPLVEVNSSYYALPSAANSVLWVERTPPGFLFSVKAFRLFTGHQTPLDALPDVLRADLAGFASRSGTIYYKDVPAVARDALWSTFIEAVQPLEAAGKLGTIHFQFAPWLFYSKAAFEHIEECRARLPARLLSVEFRHASWLSEEHRQRTLEFERRLGFVHVVVDEPQGFQNSVPAVWEVTNPAAAVVRLHGRNSATWKSASNAASDRFDYDYPDAELRELAERVKELAARTDMALIIFNNNQEDQGQRNAATLMRMLDLRW